MKIYKSNYRNHWISPYTIIDYMFFWTAWSKCNRNRGIQASLDEVEGKSTHVESPEWVELLANCLNPVSQALQWFLDLVHPQINLVKIDRYDTWSMDSTLADIILPMLRQLKDTKHGSPIVDEEDVPEYLQSAGFKKNKKRQSKNQHDPDLHAIDMDNDDTLHDRWDWVLEEIIWAFEQKVADDAESQFFDHSAYKNTSGKTNHNAWFKDMSDGLSKVKYDEAGHRAWQARKANGFRLFGKYYEALWD